MTEVQHPYPGTTQPKKKKRGGRIDRDIEIGIRTAFPQVPVTTPSVSSLIWCFAIATKITSMRKTTVVRSAAKRPTPSVRKEAPRETPPALRLRTMKSEVSSVRKLNPHAVEGEGQS